jgi:serine/threonine protein kinase
MTQLGSIQVREGDLLAGKYRIERVLGVGGMGVVFAARHEELGQLVAIKFVRDESLANDEAVERFLRESRSAARLRSEHVARVLDVGKLESGAPYMVMEFLDGSDLGQILIRDGPMPLDMAVVLMLQVCEGVAEAHAAGIVHRDLKPENLFLTRSVGGSPKMKVLDFGVSKSANLTSGGKGALTRTSAVLGSPLYMAPEQMRSSRDVDARIDIWALGVVLFELLTLRSPFEAETMPELCLKVVSEPPLSLAALRPDLPPAMVAVVERCLEKDRDRRYANASELALALEPFSPLRLSTFSLPSSVESATAGAPPPLGAPVLTPPVLTPPFGVPVLTPSIPAAWGSEGRRESQQLTSPRHRARVWLAIPFLAVVAVGVLFAVRRSGGASSSPAPPPADSTTLLVAPVPVTPIPAWSAEPIAQVVLPSLEPSSSAVAPALSNDAVATAPKPAFVPPSPVLARSAEPLHSTPLDDDIPALR